MRSKTKTIIQQITLAGANKQRCKITYDKHAQFAHVQNNRVRNIAPYEIIDGYLMATDRRTGRAKLKSFILAQITKVEILTQHFIPMWEVKL
jgi:hypothetical protein